MNAGTRYYDLVQHLASVRSKQLIPGQQVWVDVNGNETIGIIRNNTNDAPGYYDVQIEGKIINVKDNDIKLLQNLQMVSPLTALLVSPCVTASSTKVVLVHQFSFQARI